MTSAWNGRTEPPVSRDGDGLVRWAAQQDDVQLVRYADRWPVRGTRAERRARRRVLGWFVLSVLSGLAFIGVYLFWPWRYEPPFTLGHQWSVLYNPMLGLTAGLALLGLSFGLIVYVNRFLPREVAVQQRHDEPSGADDRRAAAAIMDDAGRRSGLTRRSWFGRAAGLGAGVSGLGLGVLTVGGLVRDPWDQPRSPDSLWHTAWLSRAGETVYLRLDDGDPHDVTLLRPADVTVGSFVTVVPFRESERDDPERLLESLRRADSAVMLFHLRPEVEVTPRRGQEDFNYGRFYAYSKICTHLGCPVSLYEDRANRLLCPCHQSQFDVADGCKPIFGPAVRALPQLPIGLDEDGYFVAKGDFPEPVGPSFWELGS